MQAITWNIQFFCLLFMLFVLLAVEAQSATIKVNCGKNNSALVNSTINGALLRLNPEGPNTVIVTGICNENVVIQSLDKLTLRAGEDGASINDASNGNNPTITIADSQRVTIQGFTINGGSPAVLCTDFSLCRFSQNTVQGAADDGVVISRSRSDFDRDVIQNNGLRGVVVREQGSAVLPGVTLQGNAGAGADVLDGSFLYSFQATIENNAFGIRAEDSTLRVELSTISGNALDGVQLQEASNARFPVLQGPNTITANGFEGVSVNDLSFAAFDPGNNVSGNLIPPDVVCNPQFPATRGATTNIGGGTTNCVEPISSPTRKQ